MKNCPNCKSRFTDVFKVAGQHSVVWFMPSCVPEYQVVCRNCGKEGPVNVNRGTAIDLWNELPGGEK